MIECDIFMVVTYMLPIDSLHTIDSFPFHVFPCKEVSSGQALLSSSISHLDHLLLAPLVSDPVRAGAGVFVSPLSRRQGAAGGGLVLTGGAHHLDTRLLVVTHLERK